jgi:hypothetical protein
LTVIGDFPKGLSLRLLEATAHEVVEKLLVIEEILPLAVDQIASESYSARFGEREYLLQDIFLGFQRSFPGVLLKH